MICTLVLLALSAQPLLEGDPTQKAWSVLQQAIDGKNSGNRASAIHALGVITNNTRAQRLAENALSDGSAAVRVEAASALAQMKATSARAKLRQALNDKEVKVVIAAANALYTLKDPSAYQVYYALLTGKRKGSEGLVQSQLDTLRDRKQLEMLMLETGIGFIPFGGVGLDAWKVVTRDDASAVQASAAEKLASDPDPKSGQALAECNSDKKWRIRAAVANSIAKRGDPALLDGVIPLLLDDNDIVRYEAAAAVIRLEAFKRARAKGVHLISSGALAR